MNFRNPRAYQYLEVILEFLSDEMRDWAMKDSPYPPARQGTESKMAKAY
jgi:hypothetical protein